MQSRRSLCVVLIVVSLFLIPDSGLATAPRVTCIEGATVIPAPGERLDDAAVVLRDGLIEAVGRGISPPADAVVIDGEGLWIYPGLIDPLVALDSVTSQPSDDAPPAGPVHPVSRVHPERRSGDQLTPFTGKNAARAEALQRLGFTTVLVAPTDGVFRGSSTAILLAGERPVSELILRNDVAQHIGYERGRYGGSYPTSLMGAVALIRQTVLDSRRFAVWNQRWAADPSGMARPEPVAAFVALQDLVAGEQPAVFHAASPADVLLSARLSDELGLEAAIAASGHEWEVAERVGAIGRTLILPAAFPEEPEVATDAEALEVTVETMRRFLEAPANPARLEDAGVVFALTTNGLEDPADFTANVGSMISRGLNPATALAAVTTVPASLLGIDAVAGTLSPGKIANLAVFDGPIFDAETTIRRVFVDGVEVDLDRDESKSKATEEKAESEPLPAWPVDLEPPDREARRMWLFSGATVWTQGPMGVLENADVLVADGRIAAVGADLTPPEGAGIIDAAGRHITPGLIDVHSHLALRGGVNEGSDNITAEVQIADILVPGDVNIYRQLAGGVTASHLLHGSANSIGGQDVVIKLKPEASEAELVIENRMGIKFALGENPKRSNFSGRTKTTRYPKTRMGVIQDIRRTFVAAENYRREWLTYDALSADEQLHQVPPRRDLRLESVLEILDGERTIHCHAYRQDEMLAMMRLAEEFGITVRTFEHALEGYKIADELAAHGVDVTTQSDWWGYKLEAYDAIPYNAALLTRRGVSVSMSSDSTELARRLNLEAAKAVKYGDIDEVAALAMVTSGAARQLDLGHRIGSLEPGKDADLVVWSGHPLSVYSTAEQTWVDGVREFDRSRDRERNQAVDRLRAELVAAIRDADDETPDAEDEAPTDELTAALPPPRALEYRDRLASLGGAVSIVGATVHTVTSGTIDNGTVSFRDGRIVAVGEGLPPLDDADVIDAHGKHVYPGLIDANSVVGLSEIASVAASVDIAETGMVNPAINTAIAVNPDSSVIPVTRANGLTHSLTVPTGGLVSGTSSLIRLDGWTWEDLTAAAPVAMHVSWPRTNPNRSWWGPPKSVEALAKERKEKLALLEQLMEDARAYAIARSARPADLVVDPRLEAMLPVLDGTIPVIVHAEELRQIEAAVAWAETHGLRLILAGRQDVWRTAEMLAEKKIPVIVPTVLALPVRDDEPYDTAYATAAKLHQAGVEFCIAGAANGFATANARNLPDHAAMAAAFGLPVEAALEAVTIAPARILGVGEELGSIEVGKSASLIITDDDVLEISTHVDWVFIDGRAADLETRQTRLYERYANRPAVQ
ncbi:MAG: amidohydrolase family protein [Thermoanaerobaculales bacterium]|jgi:imidazolonepropionase-like amidohydrolase|nr:amidohydrolase family protein [Thermoanaerobaculales bacterium]